MGVEQQSYAIKPRTATHVQKVKVEEYLRSVMRTVIIEQYKKKLSEERLQILGPMSYAVEAKPTLPKSWKVYLGKDKILQLYFEESIKRGC